MEKLGSWNFERMFTPHHEMLKMFSDPTSVSTHCHCVNFLPAAAWWASIQLIESKKNNAVKSGNRNGMAGAGKINSPEKCIAQQNNKS